jgi:hypothetical protein
MGFFKGLKNFTKSVMGDSLAMIEQGKWMLENDQIEAAMNNFSAACLKGEPEGCKMWGIMLIDQGTGPIDTLAGLLKLKKAIALGSKQADIKYIEYVNHPSVIHLFNDNQIDTHRLAVMSNPYQSLDPLDQGLLDKLVIEIKEKDT